MPVNPSTKPEHLTSPIQRKNDVNDPAFKNEQGYFPYDLTHPEYVTPLFGELTPTMHLDTVPADRIVHRANMKTILNRINGNFLNEVNQYSDSFFVSLRTLFPNNYEKLIPNPTKGSDLPNSALPQVPLMAFFGKWFFGDLTYGGVYSMTDFRGDYSYIFDGYSTYNANYKFNLARFAVGTYLLSRGQLLDYLGINFDVGNLQQRESSYMQRLIDNFFQQYWLFAKFSGKIQSVELDLLSDTIAPELYQSFVRETKEFSTISEFRQAFADIVEDGRLPIILLTEDQIVDIIDQPFIGDFFQSINDLYEFVYEVLFGDYTAQTIAQVDASSNPFAQGGYINISKILAYQLCVAQYYTNDSVDNIFNSELYMQLLRATMFPAVDGKSQEPVFIYNGVQTEYDYITTGAFNAAFFDDSGDGSQNRMYVWATLMLLKRRSLRYGDYFSTARPRMLAVGDLTIPVGEGVAVVDVTKNLLMQRYLNAVNYIGSGFMQYMASIFGVTPSDSGSIPRFISHSKVTLMNQLTNNTAEEQGKQTTNLVGLVDGNTAVDVFIDDFGVILDILSYDVMPVYKSGIDMNYHLADRFDYFNPMMQNIGDQPIRLSELVGKPQLYNKTFGYTMRDSEYKFKVGKAHGAFVNELKGMLISYPLSFYLRANIGGEWDESLNISPDFIRDKAIYLDPIVSHTTGASPANYYHFAVAVLNDVQCARKIQSTPPILF